jgi:D-amino peptidase
MQNKKIFISFDFEGIAGVTSWEDITNNKRFNELATQQLNFFLQGFYESNPHGKVVIADSHSNGHNIMWEKLIGNTELISGFPRNNYMVEGLDESFDSIVFFGYHAPVGHLGIMDHTYSSSAIYNMKINGITVDEAYINALVASYYNVPLKFVYGDDFIVNWIKSILSMKIFTLSSKRTISRYAAQSKPFEVIKNSLIEYGRIFCDTEGYLCNLQKSYSCEIQFLSTNTAYTITNLHNIEKIDDRTIRFLVTSPIEIYHTLMSIVLLAKSIGN